MASSSSPSVTVSAPGKILLAGGYLVLESPNVGWVVAADKRFYSTVRERECSGECGKEGEGDNDNDGDDHGKDKATATITILVTSPQFHSKWEYTYTYTDDAHNTNTNTLKASPDNASTNPFVENTLRVCFLYLQPTTTRASSSSSSSYVDITIQADNDFYSILPHLLSSSSSPPYDDVVRSNNNNEEEEEKTRRTPAAVQGLAKFLPCPQDSHGKAIVHKTGLGSSAALTTSLVGALVHYYNNSNNTNINANINTIIHNLAQICHCYAQGKVGSGFDVSAAVFGGHVYRRFPKCLLPDLLSQLERQQQQANSDNNKGGDGGSREALVTLAELVPWKTDMVTPLSLPTGNLQILLADVCGGSESPSMARKVLAWKQQQQTTQGLGQQQSSNNNNNNESIPNHWDTLQTLNAQVVALMQSLVAEDTTTTKEKIDYDRLATVPASEWTDDAGGTLKALRERFLQIRQHLKQMGDEAGVPIEPDEQTNLCDATMQIPGVVAALVPGAGGSDAIVCLYIDRPSVLEQVGDLWAAWEHPMICPLGVQAGASGVRLELNEDWRHSTTPTTTTTTTTTAN